MSNSNKLYQNGYIATVEMWPRRTGDKYPMRHESVTDEELDKHDEIFAYLYGVLEEHPMTMSEWNASFRNRNKGKLCWHDIVMFEHWVSRNHPGHMPYTSVWNELDGCARASWRQRSNEMIPSDKTVFICLLGISYGH